MKKLLIVLTVLFAFSISSFAQMGTGQGGDMMGGGWGWGMNSGGSYIIIAIIIAIAVILGLVFMKKLK